MISQQYPHWKYCYPGEHPLKKNLLNIPHRIKSVKKEKENNTWKKKEESKCNNPHTSPIKSLYVPQDPGVRDVAPGQEQRGPGDAAAEEGEDAASAERAGGGGGG